MTIQHKDIPDNQRHEPKGASAAGLGTSYISNGSGSGTWKKVGFDNLSGIYAYGAMTITGNSTPFVTTAVADTTLHTPSQFQLFSGTGAPLTGEMLRDISFTTNRLTVAYTGVYEIKTYFNIQQFPSNTAKVGLRFLINGTTYSSRGPIVKAEAPTSAAVVNAHGFISLTAGDYIQNVIASDVSGNLVISDFNTSLVLIERLA